MARNKNLLVKGIKNDLAQAQHVLASAEANSLTYEEVKSAASAALQAAASLHRLVGMLDVETSALIRKQGH